MIAARYPLRVIGDVHGEIDDFRQALSAASAAGRFVVQLGDLVDRGPDSAACLDAACDMVHSGRGLFLRGNHDDKLARSPLGRPVKAGPELTRTLQQIAARPDRDTLVADFLEAWSAAPWWLRLGGKLFVHGAFHPAMLDSDEPDTIANRHVRDKVKWLTLYAEGRMEDGSDMPTRTYRWVETIPADLTVIVGHDVRSTEAPLVVVNPAGGRAVFADTGCGKGGHLSCLDLDSDEETVAWSGERGRA